MAQRIVMHVGDVTTAALLNDSAAAHLFAERLPMRLRMSASTVGCCGPAPFEMPVDAALVHRGWINGDINYNPGGGWLAVFVEDEENSGRYGDQFTIGRIEGPLAPLRALTGTYDVLIEAEA